MIYANDFIDKYKLKINFLLQDIIDDFKIPRATARSKIFELKTDGLIAETIIDSPFAGIKGKRTKVAAYNVVKDYKTNPRYINAKLKQSQEGGGSSEVNVLNTIKEIGSATVTEVAKHLNIRRGDVHRSMLLLEKKGKLFVVGVNDAGRNAAIIYSADNSAANELFHILIGGSPKNEVHGRVYRGDQRHPSGDCIKSNNLCGGSSMLHSGYSAASTHTGARRYD
jgi:hypothetical protein